MAPHPSRDRPSSAGLTSEFSSANFTQYTGGVAAQAATDSAADFEDPSPTTLDVHLDTTSRNVLQPRVSTSRTSVNFISSPGDFLSSPFSSVTTGQQNIGIDHSKSLTLRGVISRSSFDPWNAVQATGAPDKPVNRRTKTKASSALPIKRNLEASSDISGQTSFLDSGIDLTQFSQHDTASQASVPVMDLAQFPYPGMAPSQPQPQDVVPAPGPDEPEGDQEDVVVQPQHTRKPQTKAHNAAELRCNYCGIDSKTPSDAKKHKARHEKPYKCPDPGCSRAEDGFATVNDLNRHEKSVHQRNSRRSHSYMCFATGCAKKDKVWPRLDNFKQHLIRMHPKEDIKDLVKRSDEWYAESQDTTGQEIESAMLSSQQHAERESRQQSVPRSTSRSVRPAIDRVRTAATAQPRQNRALLSPDDALPRLSGSDQPRSFPTFNSGTKHPGWAPYHKPKSSRQGQTSFGTQSEHTPQLQSRRATIQGQETNEPSHQIQTYSQPFTAEQMAFLDPLFSSGGFDGNSFNLNYHVRGAQTAPDPSMNFFIDQQQYLEDTQPINPTDADSELPDSEEILVEMGGTSLGLESSPDLSLTSQTPQTPNPVPRITVSEQEDEGDEDDGDDDDDDDDDKIAQKFSAASAEEIKAFVLNYLNKTKDEPRMSSNQDLPLQIKTFLKSFSGKGSRSVSSSSGFSTQKDEDQSTSDPIFRGKHFQCTICKKFRARRSEMTKHMMRHTRPYGCVADGCCKSFGSKNDWKRHEKTHPEQKECYRCDGTHRVDGDYCFKAFYHGEDLYKSHLLSCGVSDIDAVVAARKIPGLNQGRFWCGFCNDVIRSGKFGPEALNFRWNHIDKHIQGPEKRKAGDWKELAGENKTKTDIQRKQNEEKLRFLTCQQNASQSGSTTSPSSSQSRLASASSYQTSLSSVGSFDQRPGTAAAQMQSAQFQSHLLHRQLSSSSQQHPRSHPMQRPRSTSLIQHQQPMRRSASTSSQALAMAQFQQSQQAWQLPQQQQQILRQTPSQRPPQQQQQRRQAKSTREHSPTRTYNEQGQEIAQFAVCCNCSASFSLGLTRLCIECSHVVCNNCQKTRHPEMDMGFMMA